ncbi:glycosyltransferase family 9 protein [Hanstruepera flava]|uniref:glycosyltransferase family 9 protein n=1 Tax=Hanstruepera flava TaxID=2930218 RepID=UPI002027828E|nr:glycosyltransferase family 9 protein [Hanstruepera flava]
MKNILFLHDTPLHTPRGAELTINQLYDIGKEKYIVNIDNLKNFELTKSKIANSDLIIVCSTSRCSYELNLITFILTLKTPYIKIEFDYNFCIRRNILCTVDKKISNCCKPDKFHAFRKLFAQAKLNIFQSPKHYQAHYEFYGEAVSNHHIMPPTVCVDDLKPSKNKLDNKIPFFGDLNYLKGGKAYLAYAEEHPEIEFPVYGRNRLSQEIPKNVTFYKPISNKKVLEILGKTKTFICQPVWPEPSGRLAAEAFLSGCNIIANDLIGTFSFDFYPGNKEKAIKDMKQALVDFWVFIERIINNEFQNESNNLGKVLVYKSYGGLGDIFFALPAIKRLVDVSENVHFAVSSRLVDFFKTHLKTITIISEKVAKNQEHLYDGIYELGNYPAFRGYNLPHALKYPTHKKVKQHAIQHYIDTVSKLHINIDNSHYGYPYFQTKKNLQEPYFVLHHGAGFLLKIWPTDQYAKLIESIYELYPKLKCKIIKGPNDPEIDKYFKKPMPNVEYITGGMTDVGKAMSKALFHIGNDAGITHVAGAFNVPSVGIYGPTGPGSWGIFSEFNELIWGKKGVCDLKCNYDVILNCNHRVCLTSITVNRVLEALYKVLQKAYPNFSKTLLKVNPELVIEKGINDCLLTLKDEELLLEFHDNKMKQNVNSLLNETMPKNNQEDSFISVFNILKERNIFFEIPRF